MKNAPGTHIKTMNLIEKSGEKYPSSCRKARNPARDRKGSITRKSNAITGKLAQCSIIDGYEMY